MKRQFTNWKIWMATIAVVLVLTIAVAGTASFDLKWWTIDCGGTVHKAAGGFSLSGTIGQFDTAKLTGTGFVLQGGFWGVGSPGRAGSHVWKYYR